jgi:trimeric autotransporter adhesin
MKIPTRSTNCIHCSLRCSALLFVSLLIGCLAILPMAQAVTPAPDGGYSNGNTAEGTNALFNLTSGATNTGIGVNALFSVRTGSQNTAVGANALKSNTASGNTAVGFHALLTNTTGTLNTATGGGALLRNTTGDDNTGTGVAALSRNTQGSDNTATGFQALLNNTTGVENTATGVSALGENTTGNFNTADGFGALDLNTVGAGNTATGYEALSFNISGGGNTAIGQKALFHTLGSDNTAVGDGALSSNTTAGGNTAMGGDALASNTTGHSNLALGVAAGFNATTGSNNVYIGVGMLGVAGESNACYIASIFGQTSANGTAVSINSSGKLGTITSSRRFKDDIKPMDKASEAVFALNPVTFRYKKDLDPLGIPQFGLVAEDVARINPDLVVRDTEGKPYTVRYDAVNAMLLNEFLKEHREMQELKKQVAVLTAGLQKVSAQLELNKQAPQTALNNQ